MILTCVHRSILKMFQRNCYININEKKDRDAFDLQNKKKEWGSLFKFWQFYSLILADNVVISLLFVIINGSLMKYVAVTGQCFLWKLRIMPL